ncbi:ethanolamine ammonia-lyase subunit EutC [Aureimonas jatrophae]|uniref:Ethanolamine ammonia-lyase small subunit n=1 Tax=Aureimonas jatrophae TaxID=1166073 RepID=A0A1H0D4E5_9HYPH|nr:ethanolamine ammonia-lyase subunit EutC [Aureimonas jatrophae]MBB3951702.1 ethanolamine ammonia-lyase small subunit [Aureimonas jatrophae]SDN65013.1 Ethanolamine ammonia-lyase light chain [Aureimonas jatrophae]
MSGEETHPLAPLRALTQARIALGRRGGGLPTGAHLDFAADHARARDAVHADLDVAALRRDLEARGLASVEAASRATSRAVYLRRPDLGRALDEASRQALEALREAEGFDLAIMVAGGLSALAAERNGACVAAGIAKAVPRRWRLAPVVVAHEARVALGDAVGEALGARLVVILIGERPGLSAADSLGAYLTYGPRVGLTDESRNCISNIRAGGLAPGQAGARIAALLRRADALGASGVALKDDEAIIEGVAAPALADPSSQR